MSAQDDDGELFDGDGYPSEWALRQIRESAGTPHQFIDRVGALWWTPQLIGIAESRNDLSKPVVQVRLAIGGWSGNEVIIAELDRTFFSLLYWQSSHRGGLHLYEVPVAEWDTVGQLGLGSLPGSRPPEDAPSSVGGLL